MVLPLLLALVLLALLALPWAAGLGAILLQGALHRRLLARERHLSTPARHWLRSAADAEGLAVHIEVHEALTEGWFPHARTVGLSPGAADSDHPVHRAMAAHELGHAATTTTLGGLSGLLPTARLLGSGLPFATAAAFVVAALHDSLLAAVGGAVLLGLTALTHGGILLDEALASRRAWAWLARDPELTPADRRACQRAFLTAAAAYATPAAGWLL
jgi:Zn-dependent membrane protease YugP